MGCKELQSGGKANKEESEVEAVEPVSLLFSLHG
jgi:hypothetical protein